MSTRQKKRSAIFLGIVCIGLATVLLMGPYAKPAKAAQTIELVLSVFWPASHDWSTKVIDPWVAEVKKATDGRVNIIPYYSSTLCTPPETFDSIVKGVFDIGTFCVQFQPGRFPLTESSVITRSDLICERPSRVFWELYKKFPQMQAEYKDVHLLWLNVSPWVGLATIKKPIRSLEDLRGLKINSLQGGFGVKRLRALMPETGIVSLPIDDVYLALEKGVIDGTSTPYELLVNRKWGEHLKHFTRAEVAGYSTFWMAMNREKWASLPKDIQKKLTELCGENIIDKWDKALWKVNESHGEETAAKMGVKYYDLSRDEFARWVKIQKPVREEYIGMLKAKGLPSGEFIDAMDQLMDKYKSKKYAR